MSELKQADTVAKETQIMKEESHLDMEVNKLFHITERLEKTLERILTSNPPEDTTKDNTIENQLVPLADAIRYQRRRIKQTNHFIQILIERIEL